MKLILGLLLFVGLVSCGENQNFGEAIPGRSEFSLQSMQLTSTPARCQSPAYSKDPACLASNPDYCRDAGNSTEPACIVSHPDYCQAPTYSREPACFAANPDYCQSGFYTDEPACIHASQAEQLALYCQQYDQRNLCPTLVNPPNG